MALTAAQLLIRVKADPTQAITGLQSVTGMLGPGGALGMAAAATGAIMLGVSIAAVKMAGDFQAGVTSLITGAGESRKNIDLVSQGLLQMAVATGTSTQQLTDGMYMIESAGFHGASGLKILQAAAEGAKVGNADLGVVADATTTILKDYPGVMNGASGAVNTLVATVANGKTHMQDLSAALSQVLPTGAAAKVGLNDVMGAMATMTGEGVPAANAATYLRQTILALDAPGKAAQKTLRSVGLTSSAVASEMQKSLPGALQMITDAVGKKFPVGSAGYMAALKNILGGSKQMQGVLDLTGGHLKDFQANVGNVAGAVQKGGHSITGWSDVQKTFNFQMSQAKEVAQTLMIQLGQKLLPIASQFISFLTGTAVPAVQHFVTWISGSSQQAQTLRPVLIGLGVAIGGALVAAFVAWAGAAAAAAVATIAATWPILAIGAGIALLIGGIVLLVTHWKQVTAAFHNFMSLLGNFKDWLISHLATPLKLVALALLGPIGPIILLITHWQQITTLLGHFKDVLGQLIGHIAAFVGDAIGRFITLSIQLPAKVAGMAVTLLGHLKDMALQGLERFGEFELNGLKVLARMAVSLPGKAKDMVTTLLGHLKDMALQALKHFGELELNGLKVLARMVISIPAKVRDMVTGALGHLKDMAVNGLKSVGEFELNIVNKAKQLATNFISALAGLPGKLLDLGKQLMTMLAQGIASAGGAVLSALKNIPGIGGLIGNLGGIIPKFATGTVDAPGGLAYVHKDELIELPAHSKVHTANETRQMLGGGAGSGTLPAGLAGGAGGMVIQSQPITLTLDGRVVAQSVVKHIPTVLRNATGTRAF